MLDALTAVLKAALEDHSPQFNVAINAKNLDNLIAFVKRNLTRRAVSFVYYAESKRLLLGRTIIQFEAIDATAQLKGQRL